MTKDDVLFLMRSSANEAEWNVNCDKVKKAHEGGYPEYWFRVVIQGGILGDVIQKADTI